MSRQLVAVVALAAFQSVLVSAVPKTFDTESAINRVPGHKIGDACHPNVQNGTINCKGSHVAHCVAEQVHTSFCETFAGRDPEAYGNCTVGHGSTLRDAQEKCLRCKTENGFMTSEQAKLIGECQEKAAQLVQSQASGKTRLLSDHFNACMDWETYNNATNESKVHSANRRNPLEKSPITSQRVGEFTLDGKTYPAADKDCGADEPAPEAMQKPLEKSDPLVRAERAVTNHAGTNRVGWYFTPRVTVIFFMSPTNFKSVYFEKEPLRIEGATQEPATEHEVHTLPNVTECVSCREKSISKADMDKVAVAPVKEASEQGKKVMSLVVSGQISLAVGQEDIEKDLATTPESIPVPDIFKSQFGAARATDKAKGNQKQSSGRCLRKRRATTAEH